MKFSIKPLVPLYAILVLVLHVIPTGFAGVSLNQMEFGAFRADYLLHSLIFLPWMPLAWFYMRNRVTAEGQERRSGPGFRSFAGWLMAGIILAAGAEGIQYWIPYRSFNPMDLVFNVSGVLVGSVVFLRR